MMLHLQMFKKINVVYRPFLMNVTEDFCQRFEKKVNAPYLNILLNIGGRYSNLNHTCPYEGWLMFKDLELDLSSLKLLLPDGEYRLDIEPTINDAKSPAFVMQFFLEFTAKLGRK
ncbi:uncharacterized protein LOC129906168 [Episyrphus balteatus]|uniref:uncharacterized protein LOC129906168 n=1 Tax=Episyrphus balteatus TaxID=286459 RepID=UPI002484E8BA|nr:uncharacterized protein LOC129906168 [Episyrphus balteatus]